MKILYILLIASSLLIGQTVRDMGIFGTVNRDSLTINDQGVLVGHASLLFDTLNTAEDTLYSRIVEWPEWGEMNGGLVLWGTAINDSSVADTITVKMRKLLSISTSYLDDEYITIGTIILASGATNYWRFDVSDDVADWDICEGYRIYFIHDPDRAQIRFLNTREKAR